MRGRGAGIISNPVLVGAVTLLVTLVAVFLAYNANRGLPFVPTSQLNAVVPDAYKLVAGNEVREGGFRIGVVDAIRPVRLEDDSAGATLTLKLDAKAAPIPADSSVRIRPRSALGLKYVELVRGDAADTLDDGDTITVDESALTVELEDFFNIFDTDTRVAARANLEGYGNAFAGRGRSLNQAFEALPEFFEDLPPVMRVLAERRTRLARLFAELGDAARISAPLAVTIADGFRAGADVFEALARDPEALKQTIAKSPETLAVGERSLRRQRPFLRNLTLVAADLRGAAQELRRASPVLTTALRSGIKPLRATPALNRRLGSALTDLRELAEAPGTDRGVLGLSETMRSLNSQLRYIGPFITVCNYWNYWWTYLADHLSDEEGTGTVQRIQAKSVAPNSAQAGLDDFGEPLPVDTMHNQVRGAAIDDAGNADCETGQRGFPRHLAKGLPDDLNIAIDPTTPGNSGPTFTGRPRVLDTQTFDRLPSSGPSIRP